MDDALAKEICVFLGKEGLAWDTFLAPIFDRVMAAPALIAPERAYDYRDVLAQHHIKVVFDYNTNQRFSSQPANCKVVLGVDGLERSWAYSCVFTGGWTAFLADTAQAISAPSTAALDDRMHRALWWALESDVEKRGAVYPEGLPKPIADPSQSTESDKLHFNTYVTAVAWITLHEIAHVVLGHSTEPDLPLEQQRSDELAADAWAGDWLLEKAPDQAAVTLRLSGIVLGVALAAYLELWTDELKPRDHPIFPERLLATLDRFEARISAEGSRWGCWVAGAILIFHRTALAGRQDVFGELNPFTQSREYILKARDAYPNL